MCDSWEIHPQNLPAAAKMYRRRGWSVIPLWGNSRPESPKAAAIPWAAYQQRRPSEVEIDAWFVGERFGALGIVCGAVSNLAVLDFDSAAAAEAFARACPDLTLTLTVRSGGRGLPHYYYHVPRGLSAPGKRIKGADFQSGGTYVVAPPSAINGQQWEIMLDQNPRTLSGTDVRRIHTFLDTYAYVESDAARAVVEDVPMVACVPEIQAVSGDGMRAWYRTLAQKIGRNNALFRVATLVRDAGWTLAQAVRELLDCHAVQPPNGDHPRESVEQRRREGHATLNSAFSRPARSSTLNGKQPAGLPNTIRERLLQLGLAAVARVLDGLLMAGLRAGQSFTEAAACHLLHAFRIGRRTVQAALNAAPVSASAPPNPPSARTDADGDQQKKCFFVSGADRVKTSGRPARTFVMPDMGTLYRLLDAQPSASDPLQPADLESPAAYRKGLERALLARRPGTYSRRWLSERLGISVWTLRRYHRALGAQVRPTYAETPISWHTLNRLMPVPMPPDGSFLESEDGKRFPPIRGIAARLLAAGEIVTLKQQHYNYYKSAVAAVSPEMISQSVSEVTVHAGEAGFAPTMNAENIQTGSQPMTGVFTQESHAPEAAASDSAPAQRKQYYCANCLAQVGVGQSIDKPCRRCGQEAWTPFPDGIFRDVERCKAWWSSLYRAKYPEKCKKWGPVLNTYQEQVAARLVATVRRLAPDKPLLLEKARALVAEYTAGRVEWAIRMLNRKRDLRSPAGFAIAIISGKRKAKPAPKAAEPEKSWLESLATSEFVDFFLNADQIRRAFAEQKAAQAL